MSVSPRRIPWGIWLFLAYSLLLLAAIGVALPSVIELAIGGPLSFQGIVVMILLAYAIFTVTLVLQRKQAARPLALGLASLTLPTALVLLASGLVIQAVFVFVLGVLLFRGLLRPGVSAWLSEP